MYKKVGARPPKNGEPKIENGDNLMKADNSRNTLVQMQWNAEAHAYILRLMVLQVCSWH